VFNCFCLDKQFMINRCFCIHMFVIFPYHLCVLVRYFCPGNKSRVHEIIMS
jgi:hypothetical protein